jgi:hypothetical protein
MTFPLGDGERCSGIGVYPGLSSETRRLKLEPLMLARAPLPSELITVSSASSLESIVFRTSTATPANAAGMLWGK